MSPRSLGLWFLLALSACSGLRVRQERDALEDKGHPLPLKRVRLYASGVGYFERRGTLSGERDTLPVPASHLDDALKSLVLLSPSGRLDSISFASRLSPAVARARAGLPAEEDEALSYDRLLVSLRGERVEVNARGITVRGRVVEVVAVGATHPTYVHAKAQAKSEEEPEVLHVLLLAESGQLLRFDSHELVFIRPLDPAVRERLEAALSAQRSLRSSRHQALLLDAPQNTPIALGYLAETAVWRPSYRLVLEHPKTPDASQLQAWALVHNDSEEPWRNVQVELANGQPVSFLFPLSAPRYDRRDLHTPESELSSVPQLSTTTPDAMWGDFSEYEGETLHAVGGAGGIGLGQIGSIGHGSGYGSGAGSFRSGHAERALTSFEASALLPLGDLAKSAPKDPAKTKTVSVFQLAHAIDLPAHHSAMVPFVDAAISTRALVWFSGFDSDAERAVMLRNDTVNTLAAGPLAVFGAGGFLGEAELDLLKPGERRFARIGRDPEIEMDVLGRTSENDEKRLSAEHGYLIIHQLRTQHTRFRLRSRSERTREVYVALAILKNATLSGSDRIDYDRQTDTAFAVFDVAPGATRALEITSVEGLTHKLDALTISSEELARLAALQALPEADRQIARAAIESTRAFEQARDKQSELEAESELLQEDVSSLREHLKSVAKGEAGGAQDQVMKRILERDEQLRKLKAERRALDAELTRKEQALSALFASPQKSR
jgi:hypothetical protein